MKRLFLIGVFALLVFLIALWWCGENKGSGTTITPVANIIDVAIRDNFFDPAHLVINAGTSVRWTNNGALEHTSTAGTGCTSSGLWTSGTLTTGQSFTRAFATNGT